MIDNEEIIKDFLIESGENLDQLDKDFVALEKDPTNAELLSRIFRAIHTIKGTCGFFGFSKLEKVAHGGENLLSQLREGEILLNPERTTALLATVDAVREILSSIEATGGEGANEYAALVESLEQLQGQSAATSPAATEGLDTDPDAYLASMATPKSPTIVDSQNPDVSAEAPVRLGELMVGIGWASPIAVDEALDSQYKGDPRPVGEILADSGQVSSKRVSDALDIQREVSHVKNVSDSTIRVDVQLLDRLMNIVGELVLSRNQTLQFISGTQDSGLQAAAQRLNLITTELQEAVMKTRMQPISSIWGRFPRVVRDLSVALGKKIRLEMEGQDTELDRTILEAIKDPLTHIVRNSVDHGIETPETRALNGKPEEGKLHLRAYHEGGQVIIEIKDDGAGVNTARVAEKAIERGLLGRDDITRMSERELTNLIFLPGFSTAEKVSNISGRGVGMDVVKTNIEKIGGSIDLCNEPGLGASLKIKIPLTLTIIPALIVTCRDGRYAIPQASLLELVRLEGAAASNSIEMVHGCPVYRLRGNLLPLVYLEHLLDVDAPRVQALEDAVINIVVVQCEEHSFGLVVEEIHDTEEIVVKPLGKQLQHVRLFAGAAVMGDGRISLILDVAGIARAAHVLTEELGEARREPDNAAQAAQGDTQSLLILNAGSCGHFAMPLSMVARLEEFETENIEHAGDLDLMQYRGQILPLVYVGDCFGGNHAAQAASARENLQVVVYGHNGNAVGLVVDEILDIADEVVTTTSPANRRGVLHTAVIQNRVTEILDLNSLIGSALPAYADALENESEG